MTDRDEPGPVAPSWPLSIAIAGVILAAVTAGVVTLADRRPPVDASTGGRPASTQPTPSSTTPSSTAPSSTAPSSTAPSSTAPSGWTVVDSSEGRFSAAWPGPPTVTAVPITTTSGSATRIEHTWEGPAGVVVSVTSIPGASGSTDAARQAVVAQVGRDLGAAPTTGPDVPVDGAAGLPFRVRTADGQVRGVVVGTSSGVVTVSMFTPGTGPTDEADSVFDRLLASLRVR